MLRALRENTGNWIIKIFLGIIVIVFVFLGVGSFGSKRNNSVATVNDEPITIDEYKRAYNMIVEQMRARFGKNLNDDILKALNVKQQAVDALIEEKLLLMEAEKLGLVVSDEEVQRSVLSINAFKKDGQFNLEQYKRVLGLNSLTPESFEASQVYALLQQKIRDMVFSSVNVTDLEASNWYIFQNTKIKVDYLEFSLSDFSDIKPAEDQLKAYYDKNRDKYKSEPEIQVLYLKFSPEDYKEGISIGPGQIKEYYDSHIEEFRTPEMAEARHILIKTAENAEAKEVDAAFEKALEVYNLAASKDQDFAELAKKYSEGPSAENGGYLGKFEKTAMVKPFADQVFSMKPGDISKPVKTRFGWHIIKLEKMYDASTQTLEQAEEKIRKDLEKNEMINLAYDKAGEAFDAVIDGDDFEQVALIAGKKAVQTGEFAISGNGLDIPDKGEFARFAFGLPVDKISDVKQFGDSYYIIKVLKKTEPAVLDFADAKDSVIKDLKLELQKEKAKKQAELYLTKIKETNDIEKVARDYDLKLKTTKLFSRNGAVQEIGNSSEFVKAGFKLSSEKKIYPGIIETGKGFYILSFKESKNPDEKEIAENIEDLKAYLLEQKKASFYQAWLAQLKKENEIKYNTQILN